MSKPKLKKELQKLTKQQLMEQVLDLYGKNKSVKEFYDFYLNPQSENELAEKYIAVIKKEFNKDYPKISIAKKAIADFRALSPSAENLGNVMMALPEAACKFTHDWGDMDESFYNAAFNNFRAALKYIQKNGLLEQFKNRAEMCMKWASPCGYGFADDIGEVYLEHYKS